MAIAALIISVITFSWHIYEFYFDKIGRLKITNDFHPNFLVGDLLLVTMYEFSIVQALKDGLLKTVVTSIVY